MMPSIIIVDDEAAVREVLHRRLTEEGYPCVTSPHALDALTKIGRGGFAMAVLDIRMPEIDGIELLRQIKHLDPDLAAIMVTAVVDLDSAVTALKAGAFDYITKPFHLEQVVIAVERGLENRRLVMENRDYQRNLEIRVEEKTRQVRQILLNAIESMAHALEAKDAYSEGHSRRVAERGTRLAQHLALPSPQVENLRLAGLLHDVGKIGLREGILSKPAKLTADEYEHVKTHPLISARILEPIEELQNVIPAVRHHHERFDGHGYPDGIAGENIPLGARVLAVADVYDALTSPRPYRGAFSGEVALSMIEDNAGSQFDPAIARLFVRLARSKAPPQ